MKQYLKALGLKKIEHEPEGCSKFPDFRIDGNIGVEVTRLNQYSNEYTPKPLDNDSLGISNNFKNSIEKKYSGIDSHKFSAFVFINFSRPITNKKIKKYFIPEIINILDNNLEILKNKQLESCHHMINEQVQIELMPAGRFDLPYEIVPNDYDGGGFVLDEMKKSLHIIVKKKSAKIKECKKEYKKWWLALIDTIGYCQTQHNYHLLKQEKYSIKYKFDEIIFIPYSFIKTNNLNNIFKI